MKKIFRHTINELEKLVQELSLKFPQPITVPYGDHFVFRHPSNVRSDILASFLKTVRIVSLLNASLCLLENGYTQESYILCRAIDEACEDITFLALSIGETGTSDDQKKLLKEFYQEEFDNSSDFLSSAPRDRVGRKKIRAAISSIPIEAGDPHTIRTTVKAIDQLFSGFVHGAYVFIMEMFGGRPPRYHMHGMSGTPRIFECEDNFVNHLYRSILAVGAVAHRAQCEEVALRTNELSKKFAETTGCLNIKIGARKGEQT